MHSDFFREDKPKRLFNPTYVSNHFLCSIVNPNYSQIHQKKHRQKLYSPPLQEQIRKNPEEQKIIKERSKNESKVGSSRLSNYGSTSLKQLTRVSDHDIVLNQAKKYDIISNSLKGSKQPNVLEMMGRKEDVSGKITQKGRDEKMDRYMGISTMEQNMKEQERQKLKNRAYYLNNADEIQF